jgi:hypothetical protein
MTSLYKNTLCNHSNVFKRKYLYLHKIFKNFKQETKLHGHSIILIMIKFRKCFNNIYLEKESTQLPGVVDRTYNPSTREADAGGPAWAT